MTRIQERADADCADFADQEEQTRITRIALILERTRIARITRIKKAARQHGWPSTLDDSGRRAEPRPGLRAASLAWSVDSRFVSGRGNTNHLSLRVERILFSGNATPGADQFA